MLKNRLLFGLLFAVGALAACEKPEAYDAEAQYAEDEKRILAWVDSFDVKLEKDPSGLYYQVIEPGTGDEISTRDSLAVAYRGRLLDTTIFSSAPETSPYRFNLNETIEGWQRGLPLVRGGGEIRLLIPSTMAYRDFPVSGIPLNSPLDFTVKIIEVIKK